MHGLGTHLLILVNLWPHCHPGGLWHPSTLVSLCCLSPPCHQWALWLLIYPHGQSALKYTGNIHVTPYVTHVQCPCNIHIRTINSASLHHSCNIHVMYRSCNNHVIMLYKMCNIHVTRMHHQCNIHVIHPWTSACYLCKIHITSM